MLRDFYDRLAYACIGAVLGAVLGVAFWYCYSSGLWPRTHGGHTPASMARWVKSAAAIFAAIGFVCRADVGAWAGSALSALHDAGRPAPSLWGWLPRLLLLLAGVGMLVWWKQ